MFLTDITACRAQVEHKLDPATGKRRGFGFIRFKDVDVQQQVLQKKFFQLGDREVKVTIPVDKVN